MLFPERTRHMQLSSESTASGFLSSHELESREMEIFLLTLSARYFLGMPSSSFSRTARRHRVYTTWPGGGFRSER